MTWAINIRFRDPETALMQGDGAVGCGLHALVAGWLATPTRK